MKNHNWRVFFAIPVETETQEELRQSLILSEIKLPTRVLNPSSWHITIFFIGAIEHSKVDLLTDNVRSKTWPEKFELVLDHLGAFPNEKNARILWCGIGQGESRLEEIVSEISQTIHEMGFPTNPRFSNGHLTLCRLPEPKDITEIVNTQIHPVHLQVNRFALYRSEPELGPQYYEELASFNLSDPW